jgi:glycosyltransferase involved in cell wall biosynthesis
MSNYIKKSLEYKGIFINPRNQGGSLFAPKVCIISPGMLEVPTNRGGGREEQHFRVGLELSKYFHVIMISPFYRHFKKSILINDCFRICEVYSPALRDYPPVSTSQRHINILLIPLYSFIASIKVINLAKNGLRVVVVTDILTGFLPAILAKMVGIKVLFSEGNLTPWINPYLYPKKLSFSEKMMHSINLSVGVLLGKWSDSIRVQSSLIKKGMVKIGIPQDKIEVIEAGIDVDVFEPNDKNFLFNKPLKIGFIGRLTDEKGTPLLLEVCKKAEKMIPEVHFIIMGGGLYEKEFKLLKNVEHVGWIPRNEIQRLLSQIRILLFFQKDLGVAELEAMASGKAIVACNIGAIPSVIKHLENGLLCKPEADNYINAIRTLIENNSLLNKLSKNARKIVIHRFDWKIINIRWLSLLYRLMIS